MRVLVVGSGAREHAIAWKLKQSKKVTDLLVAPGNAGTAAIAQNLPVASEDVFNIVKMATERRVDVAFVGPEVPLAAGLVDALQDAGIRAFGPTRAAARIESSKSFSKGLMERYGIPHARGKAFADIRSAEEYLSTLGLPVVVKADGLAAGKGVFICQTEADARAALHDCMESKAFGMAGEKVVVEECLAGPEVSVFAFTDGDHVSPLAAACDYKRAFDGNEGPNTGGMGSYSPPAFWTPDLADRIMRDIMAPTVRAMAQEGCPFRGVLYGGLMLTSEGPKVLEYNCRLGDPETQVVLPRLKSDLLDIVLATLDGSLSRTAIEWDTDACVGVVMASGGYPASYTTGLPITGLDAVLEGVTVFHAGTRLGENGSVMTSGGRVLTVVAKGPSLEAARTKAYAGVAKLSFKNAHYRKDIARFKA